MPGLGLGLLGLLGLGLGGYNPNPNPMNSSFLVSCSISYRTFSPTNTSVKRNSTFIIALKHF